MITVKQYKIRALQYQHLDESQLMRDFRANKQVKPEFRNIHYVGYEISTQDNTLYHHATCLSDSLESLCDAIASTRLRLGGRFRDTKNLTLVYLRSYLTIDPAVFDHRMQDIMREEIELRTRSRRIDHFMAYGLQPNGTVRQLQIKAKNAIEAYGQLQKNASKSDLNNNLTLLGTYSAHPVTAEYAEHFDYAENRLRMMIDETVEWKSCAVN